MIGDNGVETVYEIEQPVQGGTAEADDAVLVAIEGGTTSTLFVVTNLPVATPPSTSVLTFNDATVTASPIIQVVVSGTTLVPGSPVTFALPEQTQSAVVLLDATANEELPSVLVVGSDTTSLALPPGVVSTTFVVGDQTVTEVLATGFTVGDQILLPGGSAVAIGADVASLATNDAGSTVLVIGDKTTTLASDVLNPSATPIPSITAAASTLIRGVDTPATSSSVAAASERSDAWSVAVDKRLMCWSVVTVAMFVMFG